MPKQALKFLIILRMLKQQIKNGLCFLKNRILKKYYEIHALILKIFVQLYP